MASQEDERQQQSAPTDLFGSLKIVSDAAQSTVNNQYDKGEVAGAASNLLGAVSQYGNLDDQQGFGKYVDQAQGYLQKYNQSGQAATDEPTQTESPVDDVAEPKRRDATAANDDSFRRAVVGDYSKTPEGFTVKSAREDDAETKGIEDDATGILTGKAANEDEGEDKKLSIADFIGVPYVLFARET